MVFDKSCIVVDGRATANHPRCRSASSRKVICAMKSFEDGQSSSGGFLISFPPSIIPSRLAWGPTAFETSLKDIALSKSSIIGRPSSESEQGTEENGSGYKSGIENLTKIEVSSAENKFTTMGDNWPG